MIDYGINNPYRYVSPGPNQFEVLVTNELESSYLIVFGSGRAILRYGNKGEIAGCSSSSLSPIKSEEWHKHDIIGCKVQYTDKNIARISLYKNWKTLYCFDEHCRNVFIVSSDRNSTKIILHK